ncbi:MAG: M14 family zinc carboxypeptidase [Solirubrobacteraceae bacterium]
MKRALPAAAAAAILAVAPAGATASDCPRIPAPPPAGRAASPERVDGYLRAVARASPIVTTAVAGHSTSGRPLRYAVVTRLAPARVRAGLARLRAVRAGRAAGARGAPAVVWLAGSVHGNEPSGTDADLRVLRALAAGCRAPALAHMVVVVLPDQNPDGRAAGTRVSGAGFDLNRDWLAATQPETRARYALLARYPPLVYADQHEQGGQAFFVPPYAAPLNPALPAAPLRAERTLLGPAIARGLTAHRIEVAAGTFDLQYPGYGDSATTLLYGAAGMTLEAGDQQPFARRVAAHEVAARALLRAVARHRADLLRGWAAALAPPRAARAAGWALGPGARAAVSALLAEGVRVRRLAAGAHAGALRPWGATAAAPAEVPAGSFVVPARQPLGRWAAAVLGEDRSGAVPGDDVSAWSLGLFAGAGGGTLAGALPTGPSAAAAPQPAGGPLTGRRVALLADPGAAARVRAGLEQPNPGTAAAHWALAHQLGAAVDVVDGAAIAGGALAGHDALVVADGTPAQLGGAATAAIRAWVLAGGTLAGWRERGVAVARAAGLSAATLAPPLGGRVAGTALEVSAGATQAWAVAAADPVLAGGTPAARYGDGSAAALDDRAGAGRVLLLGFDPAFRAATPGAATLLSRLLLASGGAR